MKKYDLYLLKTFTVILNTYIAEHIESINVGTIKQDRPKPCITRPTIHISSVLKQRGKNYFNYWIFKFKKRLAKIKIKLPWVYTFIYIAK